MPTLDPLAARVVRRHLADIEPRKRVSIEYQRRLRGLERIDHEDDGEGDGPRADDIQDAGQAR